MNNNWRCPQCGCNSYHYSHTRGNKVCDQCGHVIMSTQQMEENIAYDRNIALAKEHLRVGNWDDCIRLVKPLCAKRPADKQLYLILLASITKGYEDFLFCDTNRRKEACEYWRKLINLRCVNGAMKEYALRRRKKEEEMRNRDIAIIMCIIGVCLFVTLLAVTVWNNAFFNILLVIGWVAVLRWICIGYDWVKLTKTKNPQSQNPFE